MTWKRDGVGRVGLTVEIDNSGIYPELKRHRGSDGLRQPSGSKRQGKVAVHSIVVDLTLIDAPITTVETKRLQRPG